MLVKDLKEKLENLPDDCEVLIYDDYWMACGSICFASLKKITLLTNIITDIFLYKEDHDTIFPEALKYEAFVLSTHEPYEEGE